MATLKVSHWQSLIIFATVLVTSDATVVQQLYRRTENARLDTTVEVGCSKASCSVSATACVMLCRSRPTCVSVNYRQLDGVCEMSSVSEYELGATLVTSPGWEYYGPVPPDVTKDGWTLAFYAKSGIGQDSHAELKSGRTYEEYETDKQLGVFSFNSTMFTSVSYRSRVVDQWTTSAIQLVKFILYEDGSEVVTMVFNGEGSDKENWFSHSRLISSPWTDLPSASVAHFSALGLLTRTFYITTTATFGDCGTFGWLVVMSMQAEYCSYENQAQPPQYLYAKNSTGTRFNDWEFGLADAMAVFVQ